MCNSGTVEGVHRSCSVGSEKIAVEFFFKVMEVPRSFCIEVKRCVVNKKKSVGRITVKKRFCRISQESSILSQILRKIFRQKFSEE